MEDKMKLKSLFNRWFFSDWKPLELDKCINPVINTSDGKIIMLDLHGRVYRTKKKKYNDPK